MPSFPEFEITVKNKIKSCGGRVFPKLNWSSPQVCSIKSISVISQ
jgi:hypothetical protein